MLLCKFKTALLWQTPIVRSGQQPIKRQISDSLPAVMKIDLQLVLLGTCSSLN